MYSCVLMRESVKLCEMKQKAQTSYCFTLFQFLYWNIFSVPSRTIYFQAICQVARTCIYILYFRGKQADKLGLYYSNISITEYFVYIHVSLL